MKDDFSARIAQNSIYLWKVILIMIFQTLPITLHFACQKTFKNVGKLLSYLWLKGAVDFLKQVPELLQLFIKRTEVLFLIRGQERVIENEEFRSFVYFSTLRIFLKIEGSSIGDSLRVSKGFVLAAVNVFLKCLFKQFSVGLHDLSFQDIPIRCAPAIRSFIGGGS